MSWGDSPERFEQLGDKIMEKNKLTKKEALEAAEHYRTAGLKYSSAGGPASHVHVAQVERKELHMLRHAVSFDK